MKTTKTKSRMGSSGHRPRSAANLTGIAAWPARQTTPPTPEIGRVISSPICCTRRALKRCSSSRMPIRVLAAGLEAQPAARRTPARPHRKIGTINNGRPDTQLRQQVVKMQIEQALSQGTVPRLLPIAPDEQSASSVAISDQSSETVGSDTSLGSLMGEFSAVELGSVVIPDETSLSTGLAAMTHPSRLARQLCPAGLLPAPQHSSSSSGPPPSIIDELDAIATEVKRNRRVRFGEVTVHYFKDISDRSLELAAQRRHDRISDRWRQIQRLRMP